MTVMRRVRSVTGRLLLLLLLISTSSCAWLDARERELIYRPTTGVPADFAGLHVGDERYFLSVPSSGLENYEYTTVPASAGQRVEIWWLPHADRNAPTLLYFHGTFRTLYENLRKIEALRQAGFAVLAVEYRGWGLSTPIIPSEQTILQDAAVAWAELQRHEPRAAQRVIYGHSMGSGVAVDLASRLRPGTDYGALILESAFTSFADVAGEVSVFARVLTLFNDESFSSLDKIGRVHAPLLMMHGSDDTTIPVILGKRLFAAAHSPKQWLEIQGAAHSDLDLVSPRQYQATLESFAAKYLLQPQSVSH